MKKIKYLMLVLFSVVSIYSQSDFTQDTKFNQSASRKVSGSEQLSENKYDGNNVPSDLLRKYNNAFDIRNESLKDHYAALIDQYLEKTGTADIPEGMHIIKEPDFQGDWYNSDIMVTSTDVAYTGSYKQMDLKQGEDGYMYLAVNRRNMPNYTGYISVYRSSNGGLTWQGISSIAANPGYYGSVSMLVESRNNNVADSTRILLYYTYSSSSNFDNASLYCASFKRDGTFGYILSVANPTAGNRFVFPSACSDGMFFSSATYMHAVVREETNAGAYVSLRHFRSVDWGVTHTSSVINSLFDDRYPVCAFSNENGTDSIYIAVERVIAPNEHEIRLIATTETPVTNFTVRYITDAATGTLYERPSITIQQRNFIVPQRILVTCTKNNKAVYHYSIDGGALWTIDASLGLSSQTIDYTFCNSDSLEAGGKDFIATFVDQDGDSVSVRNGTLGAMGILNHKMNSVQSTGALVPPCAIYKQGSNKYAAFSYSGLGPANVYYDMETFLTGIDPVSNEIPNKFSLQQNYPNPFNPETKIKFSLPNSGNVTLKVYDISGRVVSELVNENLNSGTYSISFNASKLSSGVYFYRISAEGFTDTKKMILVK